MSVIGGQNILVTNGLVYALDFKNNKSYVSGSNIAKSLIYDISTTIISGSSSFDSVNQNLNIPAALNPTSSLYGDNDFYIRRNTTFTFQATSSFTIVSNLNVRSAGVLLFQNTDASKFAAHIGTSSLEIGFYDPSTEYYYTRQYPVNLQTGSNSLIYRYDNGTSDLFINGAPVTSSRSDIPPKALQNTYYSSKVLSYPISSSFNIGIRSRLVDTYRPEFVLAPYGGSLTNFYIYNRALSTNEIYSTYIQLQPTVFRNASLIKPYTLDENTLLYVSASQVTSSAYITAIDSFVTGLKSAGLWNKLSAIYPVIGSTTSSQALNLKEPVINRLSYSGSWIASLSGSYPSSSTSYIQLSGFDYPAILTSSAHITYLSYDLPQATASLVAVDKPLAAVGGEIYYSGSRTYHVFRPTGTSSFTVISPALTSVEVLVVAGGGGSPGSGYNIGGGGAGGLVYSSSVSITTGSYNVIVGEGGVRSNGQNSSFLTVTSYGGGAGNSGNGGSGGGGGATFNTTGSGGTASYGNQGNNGGDSLEIYNWGAGGGGGHGSKGETAGVSKPRAAAGGSGSYFAQYAGIGVGTPAGWFAGGGGSGGGFTTTQRALGGIGGGSAGCLSTDYTYFALYSGPGIPTASKNTGGGGGGAYYNEGNFAGGAGGSGIVIVSYNTNQSAFTSSFGISLSGSNIVGNLHSTTTSGISSDANASIGLVTVSRTGSVNISIHKDFNSSVITAPVTASIIGSVYANASNFAGTLNKVSPYTLSYLSYGSGMTPDEVNTYHSLASKLQYDLGRGLLLQGYPAAAAYSLRQISKNYPYAINVRRGDDLQQDIGFVSGDLNTGSLLTFLTASISTPLPGDTATPAVAYSVRKVRTAYTGAAMTVRRDFDDLTFDVGFDVSGNLDTGSLLTNMTASGIVTTLPGDYSGLAAAYSLRKVSSSYLGNVVEVRRASDNYSASIAFDGLGNLNTASLASLIRTGSETPISAYSGLTAAYSVRKVVPGYTGFAIQIQSASATQDIGFNSFGDLDVTAIRTFAGSGDAFVRTWYDQSGNGYNATQTTLAVQPKIYSGSLRSVIYQNGRPAIQWDGINDNFQATLPTIDGLSQMAIISVASPEGPRTINMRYANLYFGQTLSWGSTGHVIGTTGLSHRYGTTQVSNDNNYVASIVNSIYGSYKNGVNEIGRYNGVDVTTSNTKLATLLGNDVLNIGYGEGGTMYKGKQSEILIYFSDQTSNRTYIENNINSYYGAFTPSSATTENAFVKTWYDQSGNNRHATQSLDVNQPQIVSSGVIITENGKPALSFDGSNSKLSMTGLHGQSVLDQYFVTSTSDNRYIYPNEIAGGTEHGYLADLGSSAGGITSNYGSPSLYSNGTLFTGSTRGELHTILNGYKVVVHQSASTAIWTEYNFSNYPGYTYSGKLQELIAFTSSVSASRNLITDNINGYYNIFTQSLASGSGYVTRWYDQSGNASHATQTSTVLQPLIVSSGSIQTLSGSIGLNFYKGGNPMCYMEYSGVSGVTTPEAFFVGSRLFNFNEILGEEVEAFSFNSRAYRFRVSPTRIYEVNSNTSASLVNWSGNASKHVVNIAVNGSGSFMNYNLNNGTTVNIATSSITSGYLSDNFYGSAAGGYYHEFILYPTLQVANRPSIKNNINNYYNAYVANTSTSSLFVTKWYDQSGNSKHAIQTTNAKQPIIVSSGSVITLFNKPTIRFSNGGLSISNSGYDFSTNNTLFFVHQATDDGVLMGSFYRYYRFQSNTTAQMGSGGTDIVVNENFRTGSLITSIQETGNIITAFKNGRDITVTKGVRSTGGTWESIGSSRTDSQAFYVGTISEFILNNTVLSSSIRQPIESNINSYYRIY